MMDPNIDKSTFDDRGVFEETNNKTCNRKKEAEAEKKKSYNQCGQTAERKSMCRCGQGIRSRNRTRSRKRAIRRRIISHNPYIIFYLEMYYACKKQMPCKRMTEIARQAGKEWCALPEEKKMHYVRLAEKEKKRRKRYGRGQRRRRRRCRCY
ncbi:PREDICTED: uncharacterized protein LOC108749668 [Trachymyrmex septentrionalis]|uniref:uncharacterized protein LOC108749668 n=1 Tax=Trachymyrmex septentrionalis TaxID=34720 RepID=UPI00084F380E|nr:PREDICTED: uncharacterized protein LOC108749668 [Trachymyrmex septentrionalis]